MVADLHSALPAVLAGASMHERPRRAAADPGERTAPVCRSGDCVAYVMQDGGALPAWFSRTSPA